MRTRHFFPVLVLLAIGCGGTATSDESQRSETDGGGTLSVFAAASLADAFTEIGKLFEETHPETAVIFNFAGSQQLAQQIYLGAPADVFASADGQQMRVVVESGRVDSSSVHVFARNSLVVVIPVANPGRISGLRDLTREGLRIVLAAAEVPAGHYARTFLERASGDEAFRPDFGEMVLARVVSHEQNVRSVLMKVALGEADAGIVYESDAADAAEDVMRIPIPDPLNVYASYLIAPVSDSEHLRLARAFVSLVHSPQGQSILRRHGLVAATRT